MARSYMSIAITEGWQVFVGRAPARRGGSTGTAANPGTQASGGARPTGVVVASSDAAGRGGVAEADARPPLF